LFEGKREDRIETNRGIEQAKAIRPQHAHAMATCGGHQPILHRGARIVHFIGKDIVYFHALFWPTVLKVAELHRPDRLVVHGHLTVNGEKMSKSKGTFISARQYLETLDPSYLRFFYAANLGPGVEDLDLSLNEFRLRVNADLVNNIGNLANRSLTLLAGPMGGQLHPGGEGPGRALVEEALAKAKAVREAFEQLDYRAALKGVCEISQAANVTAQSRII
jgi:methionyl-tRNA synthetase